MDIQKIHNIHFIGIKGVGMTPLAIIAKEAGFEVSGCDVGEEFITDKPLKNAGIYPEVGFHKDHIKNIDLVITTGAHGGKSNPEVQCAKEKNIPILMQGQAVGIFMKGEIFKKQSTGISIAGCHGKTTTTAMIATIFKEAGLDPSYIIGTGDIISLGGSGHYGKGEYFIAEADEYATELGYDNTVKFLWQHPKYLIITNIEFDHPDLYEDINQVKDAYSLFVKNIQKGGVLIGNGDDLHSRKIIEHYKGSKIIFGFNSNNDYIIQNIRTEPGHTSFTLHNKMKSFTEEFTLQLAGTHNVLNATAAIVVSIQAGLLIEKIKKGLLAFKGTKRRFEYIGKLVSGAELYDDYAHHPTEIKATLQALHQIHPSKKIVVIFQPHTYSRTKKLFEDLSSSFTDSDTVIITTIFASKREQFDKTVSSAQLVQAIKENGKDAILVPSSTDVVKYIRENHFNEHYCIITMGAGDIYKIHDQLITEKLL